LSGCDTPVSISEENPAARGRVNGEVKPTTKGRGKGAFAYAPMFWTGLRHVARQFLGLACLASTAYMCCSFFPYSA
jgi:hypothetical protein